MLLNCGGGRLARRAGYFYPPVRERAPLARSAIWIGFDWELIDNHHQRPIQIAVLALEPTQNFQSLLNIGFGMGRIDLHPDGVVSFGYDREGQADD